jgi:hypothetical protein
LLRPTGEDISFIVLKTKTSPAHNSDRLQTIPKRRRKLSKGGSNPKATLPIGGNSRANDLQAVGISISRKGGQPSGKRSPDQLTGHDRGRGSNAALGRKRRTVQAIENFFPVLSLRKVRKIRSREEQMSENGDRDV